MTCISVWSVYTTDFDLHKQVKLFPSLFPSDSDSWMPLLSQSLIRTRSRFYAAQPHTPSKQSSGCISLQLLTSLRSESRICSNRSNLTPETETLVAAWLRQDTGGDTRSQVTCHFLFLIIACSNMKIATLLPYQWNHCTCEIDAQCWQIIDLSNEGREDLLREMLGQRLEFGESIWIRML